MMQLICFFAPPLLAAALYKKKYREISAEELIVVYITFVGIINMLCLGAVAVLLHHPDYALDSNMLSIGFSFKYLLLGYILAVILPSAYDIIKNGIKIELVVEAEESDKEEISDDK